MKNFRLLNIVGEINDKFILEASPVAKKSRCKPVWAKWAIAVASMVLVISACFGTFAIVAEAKEYAAAVQFFDDYDMSMQGLTRGEIKAVYRDITTKSFAYSKTAEVIKNSISTDVVGGYEIMQNNPTAEDIENLWNYLNSTDRFTDSIQEGIHYSYRTEFKMDYEFGYELVDKSYIEKKDGETLLWSVSVEDFFVDSYINVSDGVVVYGNTYTPQGKMSCAGIIKISSGGNIQWKQILDNGPEYECIFKILVNDDGSYSVFSNGDNYLCISKYSPDGKRIEFSKNKVDAQALNAVRFGDGYIVQLYGYEIGERAKIVIVDSYGKITDYFSYSSEDYYYRIVDMIEFNGNVYLSTYAFPKSENDYELSSVTKYLFDNDFRISGEELTSMVRDNYTAMLLVCEPDTGTPQEFYSVKGSFGGKLSVSNTGELLWNVESIAGVGFSPYTSAFSFAGSSYVYQYTFNGCGLLLSQEKTGEIANFNR